MSNLNPEPIPSTPSGNVVPLQSPAPLPFVSPAADVDYRALRSRLAGSVSIPGDTDWDEARLAWNLAVDQRPAAVVHAESAQDVVAVIEFAGAHGYQVAPQGTGHNAGPLGDLGDTILLKTSRMRRVQIAPKQQLARVEAGALWEDVTQPAARHGLAALAGSSPDVGVVGYSVGGGVSWLGRKHGLAANSIVAVELVTADGRVVRADRENEPDLFWAVRGGGGNFGIVTALEIKLYPIQEVYAGVLFFPLERASEVLHAWREWTQDVPDEVTSVGRIMQFPPIPAIPEPLRGNAFALVEATIVGTEADGVELIAPLRELGPAMDTFSMLPVEQLQKLHMDPEHPVSGYAHGGMLAEAPAEAIDAVVAVAGEGSGSPLLSLELRHLGGALARPSAEHGALASLDAEYAWFAVGMALNPQMEAAVRGHVDVVGDALAPWSSERTYMNFSEKRVDARRIFSEHVYHRLRRIKSQVDPSGMIRGNHPIPSVV